MENLDTILRDQDKNAGRVAVGNDEIHVPKATGGPVLDLDLRMMAAQLEHESVWSCGRNTRTIVKHGDFRVVLTVMKKGACLRRHQARGTVLIQVLSGRVRIRVFDDVFDVGPGHALSLDPYLEHDLEATDESALLIAIAWPSDAADRHEKLADARARLPRITKQYAITGHAGLHEAAEREAA